MNGPDDFRDEELSRRYRHLPPELPAPETDAAIQAAARQALSAPKRRLALPGYYGGLALAASVTLVVSLLLPSWRSGRLQEQVAVPAPAAKVVIATADSDAGMAAAPVPATAPPEVARPPVGRAAPAQLARENRQAAGSVAAPAPLPAAAPPPASLPKMEAASSVEAETSAPALADQSMPEVAARAAEARHNEGLMAEQAREAPAARAKARLAVAPAPAPMAAAPVPLQKAAAMTPDALLLAGRYGEVLALLQAAPAAADPALESRRDLLRQLASGPQAVRCSPAAGPRSAQFLCQLLLQRERSAGITPAQRAAWQQALEAEGQDPVPWLQALAALEAGH